MMGSSEKVAYELIRSSRKTIGMQMKPDGTVVVRAPMRMRRADIDAFVQSNRDWVERTRKKLQRVQQETASEGYLSQEEIQALAEQAVKVIPERVKYYAPLVGVTYGRITIRNQKTRWGSCSAKGNLNFNCLLMLTPPEVLDSVVVHELCHRKYMNHSQWFYNEVLRVYPQYWECTKWLKQHGASLMQRMTGAPEEDTED